jgi:hypothetical protein
MHITASMFINDGAGPIRLRQAPIVQHIDAERETERGEDWVRFDNGVPVHLVAG